MNTNKLSKRNTMEQEKTGKSGIILFEVVGRHQLSILPAVLWTLSGSFVGTSNRGTQFETLQVRKKEDQRSKDWALDNGHSLKVEEWKWCNQ